MGITTLFAGVGWREYDEDGAMSPVESRDPIPAFLTRSEITPRSGTESDAGFGAASAALEGIC
jgi:hypothetical protein